MKPSPRVPLRAVLLTVALVALAATLAALLGTSVAMAGEPAPSIVPPLDPRSDGGGPGLVGSPLVVALGVILLGALAAVVTALVLRLTRES